jgi:hypothetical protein
MTRPPPPPVIFLVTALKLDLRRTTKQYPVVRQRAWGWMPTRELARDAVLSNEGDLFERGYYDYAVIEAVPPGLMRIVTVCEWYHATYLDGRSEPNVTACAAPEALNGVINFGLG